MLSVKQAARKLRCSPRTVRQAIAEERLTAQKVGRTWVVIEDEKFEAFTLKRPGRPKGLQHALAFLRLLTPVIQKGTKRVVSLSEVIEAVREERLGDLCGPRRQNEVVIDASFALHLVLPGYPYHEQAMKIFTAWGFAEVTLIAPHLFEAEVDSGIRRLVQSGALTPEAGRAAQQIVDAIEGLRYHLCGVSGATRV
ncbi:MAG: helix-turn-helix domain-containing protein [Candidatus Bipolaricaulota bacterium]|nr:helix-turn-helix domain-containing protein [Candidatus Bipolaricaulota bacterium]MDW8030350.1 helix-turn-helix domain-containing protein [Candidatus Bipolaricaulota bacterium]